MSGLRQLLYGGFMLLFILPLLQSVGNIAFYMSNMDYIQKELCENRENPELHCNGTCVLARMLQDDEPASNPFTDRQERIENTFVFAFLEEPFALQHLALPHITSIPGYQPEFDYMVIQEFLIPPEHLV